MTGRKKPRGDTVLRNTIVAPHSNCQAGASAKSCGTHTKIHYHLK